MTRRRPTRRAARSDSSDSFSGRVTRTRGRPAAARGARYALGEACAPSTARFLRPPFDSLYTSRPDRRAWQTRRASRADRHAPSQVLRRVPGSPLRSLRETRALLRPRVAWPDHRSRLTASNTGPSLARTCDRDRALTRRRRHGGRVDELVDPIDTAEANQSSGREEQCVDLTSIEAAQPRINVAVEGHDDEVSAVGAHKSGRRGLSVPTAAPGGSVSSDADVPNGSTSTSRGSSRGKYAATPRRGSSSVGRSFALWTAMSTRRSASSRLDRCHEGALAPSRVSSARRPPSRR